MECNLKRILLDYSGIFWFVVSITSAYLSPLFWANGYTTLFSFTALLLVFAFSFGTVATIMYRILNFDRYSESVTKLLLFYFELLLIFCSIYLWLCLFGGVSQIEGIHLIPPEILNTKNQFVFSDYSHHLNLAIVDSFHFSVVTGTTLGYGDMLPNSWISKLIVDAQVLITIWLVIIGYGNTVKKT